VPRWRYAVVGCDEAGRIRLPAEIRPPLTGRIRGLSRGPALVLRPEGVGAELRVDRRGRLALPLWLRCLGSSSETVLVAWPVAAADRVVVAPTNVLDPLVEALAGEIS